jgi:hypothetical protein
MRLKLRRKSVGVIIHIIEGNITRKLPVQLPFPQASLNVMFFILSFLFFIPQNWRTEGQNKSILGGESYHQ